MVRSLYEQVTRKTRAQLGIELLEEKLKIDVYESKDLDDQEEAIMKQLNPQDQ